MKFSTFLRRMIEEHDYNSARLARELGVKPSYIWQVLAGTSKPPTPERIEKISEILSLSKSQREELRRLALLERTPAEARPHLVKALEKIGVPLDLPSDSDQWVRIPQFAHCPASPKQWTSDEVELWHQLPKTIVKGRRLYLIRAKGDSMNRAGIENGDLVLVDADEQPANGNIVVICVDHEFTMKRFYRNDGAITLTPDSTNTTHSPVTYDLKRCEVLLRGVVKKIYMKELK